MCEHELSWRWDELVSDWSFADRIDFVRVDNFEYSVRLKLDQPEYWNRSLAVEGSTIGLRET